MDLKASIMCDTAQFTISFDNMGLPFGAVHKVRPRMGGGRGSKNRPILWTNSTANADEGGWGVKIPEKYADELHGRPLFSLGLSFLSPFAPLIILGQNADELYVTGISLSCAKRRAPALPAYHLLVFLGGS